jgi:hypothetical protein
MHPVARKEGELFSLLIFLRFAAVAAGRGDMFF